MSSQIKKLPEELVNQIAAGEVVERPASVVKELVENSLDADADLITIDVDQGGIKKILVVDNGSGMGEEDLKVCLSPYSTSKISNLDDLSRISSFGFRGEALSSIASVSTVKISSREREKDIGSAIKAVKGQIGAVKSEGMPLGTSVLVRNLFEYHPARRKFLKSPQTEFRHIVDVVSAFAIAFENVHFNLIHNGKSYYNLPGEKHLSERVKAVLGDTTQGRMIDVAGNNPHISLNGYVSRPELTTTRPDKQYLYVNSRRIQDSLLSAAVKKAYGTLLMPRSFPLYALFLDIPSEMVDVNVHPRKSEVAFVNKGSVYSFVLNSISQSLSTQDLTYGRSNIYKNSPSSRTPSKLDFGKSSFKSYPSPSRSVEDIGHSIKIQKPLEIDTQESHLPLKAIQIHNKYLLVESDQGFLIIDQHAAHERVLFEEFTRRFNKQKEKGSSQSLLVPVVLDMSKSNQQVIIKNLETLEKVGFTFETDNDLCVTGVPEILSTRDIYSLLNEIAEDYKNNSLEKIDDQSMKIITYLSCRSAVKSGDYLSIPEVEALINKLESCSGKYTCPHGRPVSIDLSLKELDKMFKRTL